MVLVTLESTGEVKSIAAWARDPRCRVKEVTLRSRLDAGVPLEQALVGDLWGGGPARRLDRARGFAARLQEQGITAAALARELGVSHQFVRQELTYLRAHGGEA